MKRASWLISLFVCLVALLATRASAGEPPEERIVWRDSDAQGAPRTHLYFFWSQTCPHCLEARPVVQALDKKHEWLELHSYDVTSDPQAGAMYNRIAESLGESARFVPGFAYCETLVQEFQGAEELERGLLQCHRSGEATNDAEVPSVRLPFVGTVEPDRWSLPVTTVVLGGLDAFNPCAFFVLLFLLSLLVRAESRARMLAISGIFVVFSGLWYFLFMAAWLNVFLWVGELRWITLVAGIVAIVMAAFNIKDFVAPSHGPSLAIPESAKPSLFARMRRLVRASSWGSVVAGTVLLAGAANTYELLCTAGFPMIYTRILTLADLPVTTYYLYLALYNLVYIVPLLVIVAIFIKTLGSRKLQEREGRSLKLLSGCMMLGLGILLVVAPQALSNLVAAGGLLLGSVVVTALAVVADRRLRGSSPAQ